MSLRSCYSEFRRRDSPPIHLFMVSCTQGAYSAEYAVDLDSQKKKA